MAARENPIASICVITASPWDPIRRADGSLNVAASALVAAAPEAGVGVAGTCGAADVEADGAGAGAGALGVAAGAALAGVDGPPAAGFG